MTEPRNCVVMRRDGDNLSPRGPLALTMTEAEAKALAKALARQNPNQQFVILTETAIVEATARVTIKASRSGGGDVVSIAKASP